MCLLLRSIFYFFIVTIQVFNCHPGCGNPSQVPNPRGDEGGLLEGGVPWICTMSGHSLARHLQCAVLEGGYVIVSVGVDKGKAPSVGVIYECLDKDVESGRLYSRVDHSKAFVCTTCGWVFFVLGLFTFKG